MQRNNICIKLWDAQLPDFKILLLIFRTDIKINETIMIEIGHLHLIFSQFLQKGWIAELSSCVK